LMVRFTRFSAELLLTVPITGTALFPLKITFCPAPLIVIALGCWAIWRVWLSTIVPLTEKVMVSSPDPPWHPFPGTAADAASTASCKGQDPGTEGSASVFTTMFAPKAGGLPVDRTAPARRMDGKNSFRVRKAVGMQNIFLTPRCWNSLERL